MEREESGVLSGGMQCVECGVSSVKCKVWGGKCEV